MYFFWVVMIKIITGKIGSGKTSRLLSLIDENSDGIITICKNRNPKEYDFYFIKQKSYLSCCKRNNNENKMYFFENNFLKANEYLKEVNAKNIFIDEISYTEYLENKGFHDALIYLLKNKINSNFYLSLRFEFHKEIISKYNINYDEIEML